MSRRARRTALPLAVMVVAMACGATAADAAPAQEAVHRPAVTAAAPHPEDPSTPSLVDIAAPRAKFPVTVTFLVTGVAAAVGGLILAATAGIMLSQRHRSERRESERRRRDRHNGGRQNSVSSSRSTPRRRS